LIAVYDISYQDSVNFVANSFIVYAALPSSELINPGVVVIVIPYGLPAALADADAVLNAGAEFR
jgi:hypothetical protein